MQAFILAAGKGTRLHPFTNLIPKPLFPILGKPILNIILDQLVDLGIKKIGINTYHLKTKIINFIKTYQKKHPEIEIQIFEEPQLLGTGGAILNAKNFFKKPTLIINSDILTNLNFKILFEHHFSFNFPITMIFYKGTYNNVSLDPDLHNVLSFRTDKGNLFSYAGIQIVNPDIIPYFLNKKDLIEIYQNLVNSGIKIGAFVSKCAYFKDIGTVSNYLNAHEDILIKKIKIPFAPFFNNYMIIKNAKIGKNVSFKNWVFIDDETVIENNTVLSKCISWKKAYIKTGYYNNCVFV